MRMVKFIGLMTLAGVYCVEAIVLGLKGFANIGQLVLCAFFCLYFGIKALLWARKN